MIDPITEQKMKDTPENFCPKLDRLNYVYQNARCIDDRFENYYTRWKHGEHLDGFYKVIDYNVTSLEEMKKQHEERLLVEWEKKKKDLEPGEIVEMYIEFANYEVWQYTYSTKHGFGCEKIV